MKSTSANRSGAAGRSPSRWTIFAVVASVIAVLFVSRAAAAASAETRRAHETRKNARLEGKILIFQKETGAEGKSQLWAIIDGGKPVVLTHEKGGVGAFAYHPALKTVFYQRRIAESDEGFEITHLVSKKLPDGQPETVAAERENRSVLNPIVARDAPLLAFNTVDFSALDSPAYDVGVFVKKLGEKTPPARLETFSPIEGFIHIPLCVSPKGKYLAVQRAPLNEPEMGDSLVVESGSGKILHVLKDARIQECTPDGRKILVSTLRKNGMGAVLQYASLGSPRRTNVTAEGFSDEFPSWAPDGRNIVCHSRSPEGGSLGIWNISVETGDRFLLTDDGINPRWSPSGEGVFYVRLPDGGRRSPEIWWMGTDGKDAAKITEGGESYIVEPWAPAPHPHPSREPASIKTGLFIR
ncbi:MAG: hypothetical protein AB1742_08780 [bacterium]